MTDAEREALLNKLMSSPKSATIDGQSANARSLSEVTEAMDYLARRNAAKRGAMPQMRRWRPGGAQQ